MSRAARIGLVVVGLMGSASVRVPPAGADFDPATRQALVAYLQDPQHNRAAVLRLARNGTDNLSLPVLMALADAQLRSGRSGTAQRLFEQILAQDPGPPSEGVAAMGLAWAAIARGDLEAARGYFAVAPEAGGDRMLATMMTALIDASSGDPGGATERLSQLLADPATPPGLVPTLRLVEGYTRYWSGDLPAASAAFADVAGADPAAPAADDARYALALARSRVGDTGGAEAALADMTRGPTARRPRPGELTELDPRAVLRATFRRFRHAPLTATDVASLASGDGPALARASVRGRYRRLTHTTSAPASDAPSVRPSAGGAGSGAGSPSAATRRPEPAPAVPERAPAAHESTARGWLVRALAVAALLLAAVFLRGRRTT